MRRAFTLIELLVIVGIIASMVTVSVLSVRSGQDAVRMRGAARDVFATIRRARSTALLTQKPAVVTYSCVDVDGEPVIKIDVKSEEIMDDAAGNAQVQTLSGAPLTGDGILEAAGQGESVMETGEEGQGEGHGIGDVLFKPIDEEVVRGMRIKVTIGDETLDPDASAARAGSRISIFSTADYVSRMYVSPAGEKKKPQGDAADAKEESMQPVSVVWETNGRVEPHRVWVYADGAEPDSGLSIKIDRFGAAKILATGEDG